jgi:hypothetical protein
MNTIAKTTSLFARCIRDLVEARKRRAEQDREFYRNLNAYCRANNLSSVCEDDWKTAAYAKNDDNRPMIQPKGHVPWTKSNLPR